MICPLCQRDDAMEKHHLRTRKTAKDECESVCRACHVAIHGLFTNQELRDVRLNLDSVDGLLANERFQESLKFIQKLPVGTSMRMRLSNHARGGKRKYHG
jgi:hypothetical protein